MMQSLSALVLGLKHFHLKWVSLHLSPYRSPLGNNSPDVVRKSTPFVGLPCSGS